MKFKDIFRDWSFWFLFTINLAIIIYYLYYNTGFRTLIWIYWCQSVLIGLFTFFDLLDVKDIPLKNEADNTHNATGEKTGSLPAFFVFHFGVFHLVYFIFLFTITDTREVFDWNLFSTSVLAFALDQLWAWFRRRQWRTRHHIAPGVVFLMPYIRIVPMHLTILVPAFINAIPRFGVFLFLKMLADLFFYVLTERIYGKAATEALSTAQEGK